jgi:hypothetical protein
LAGIGLLISLIGLAVPAWRDTVIERDHYHA